MLTIPSRAARNFLFVFVWAVFYSPTAFGIERPLSSLEAGFNDLVFEMSRSIVTVASSHRVSVRGADGAIGEGVENTISSGVIFDTMGHLLVAASSVVGQDRITVEIDNRQIAAQVVGVDYFTDMAVLRTPVRLGMPARMSSRQVCAGQMVMAMGNAFGLRASPAMGFCAGARPDGSLQFSVPITASSIGGGVFDLSGDLLGLIVGSIGQSSRVAVAIPAYQLPQIVDFVVHNGDRFAGYVGVSTADIEIAPPIELSSPFQLAGGVGHTSTVISQGAVTTYVAPGSPAATAGLQKGDLIIGYDNQRLNSAVQLATLVRRSAPGTTIELSFIRQNEVHNTRVTVGQKQIEPGSPFYDVEQFDNAGPSADSLAHVIDYLKQEVSRLESRLKRLH
jgi:S1-C subfamily serine protease